jgi:hypothetical protein
VAASLATVRSLASLHYRYRHIALSLPVLFLAIGEERSQEHAGPRGGSAGDDQLTFDRSFSYPYYKSLFRYFRFLDAPRSRGECCRRSRNPRVISVRRRRFIHADLVLLGHVLVSGVRDWKDYYKNQTCNIWGQRYYLVKPGRNVKIPWS